MGHPEATKQAENDRGLALPAWTRPAWQIGALRPDLRASIPVDITMLQRMPVRNAQRILPTIVVALAALTALMHALAPPGWEASGIIQYSVFYPDVYTQSMVFMAFALLLGLISPAGGALLVVLFAPMDLAAALLQGELIQSGEVTISPWPVIARLVSYWLLWLLVVEVPLIGRSSAAGGWDWAERRLAPGLGPLVAVGSGTVVTGALTYIWALAAAQLIMPVAMWAGVILSDVIWSTLDLWPHLLAGLGVVAAGLVFTMRFRIVGTLAPWSLTDAIERAPSTRLPPALALGVAALLLLAALGGVITGVLDVMVLLAGFFVSRLVVRPLVLQLGVGSILPSVPWIVRFLIAFGLTFLAGLGVSALLWGFYPPQGFEFGNESFTSNWFTLVVTIAIGLMIYEALLAPGESPDTSLTSARASVRGAGLFILVGVAWLGLAGPVSAHDRTREELGPLLGAAAGAAAAAGGSMLRGKYPKPTPDNLWDRLREGEQRIKRDKWNPPPWWNKKDSWERWIKKWEVQRFYERTGRYPKPSDFGERLPLPIPREGDRPSPEPQVSGNYNLGVGG